MTENVPAVVTGGAVVVQPTALVQVDAAAAAGAVHESTTSARAGAHDLPSRTREVLDSEPTDPRAKLTRDLLREIVIDGAFDCEGLDRVLGELVAFAPQFEYAYGRHDNRLLGQLGEAFRDHLIRKGWSRERIEWGRQAILRRISEPEHISAAHGAIAPSAAEVGELRELERMMGDLGSAYHYRGIDPLRQSEANRLQARARELYERGVRSDSKRAATPEHINSRKAELEELMADLDGEYHKGPHAEALQAEYRDLITQLEQHGRRS